MKRIVSFVLVLAALGVFASACSKKATPGEPSNTLPTEFFFSATALPSNEIPPVSNAENTGRAFASVTLRVTRDGAGTITGGVMDYGVAVTSFPSTTVFTAMHIHEGDAATNGSVRIQSGLTANELQLVNGSGSVQKSNNPVAANFATAIINNPGGFYFNIHTQANLGGVARGQLVAGVAQ